MDIQDSYPEIEWRKLAGLRDILTHEYFGVDLENIWDIVKNKIPKVETGITQIINEQ